MLRNVSRRLPFRPFLRFFYSYVVRGGFLDGKPGYVFCRLLGIYEYLSVAKYYELRRAEDDVRHARALSAVPSFLPDTIKLQARLPVGMLPQLIVQPLMSGSDGAVSQSSGSGDPSGAPAEEAAASATAAVTIGVN
jgi:hypothetical protein